MIGLGRRLLSDRPDQITKLSDEITHHPVRRKAGIFGTMKMGARELGTFLQYTNAWRCVRSSQVSSTKEKERWIIRKRTSGGLIQHSDVMQ
jgi:hypothetical protein